MLRSHVSVLQGVRVFFPSSAADLTGQDSLPWKDKACMFPRPVHPLACTYAAVTVCAKATYSYCARTHLSMYLRSQTQLFKGPVTLILVLQDNNLAVAACSALSQMSFIAPDLVLPLVQNRFQVGCTVMFCFLVPMRYV